MKAIDNVHHAIAAALDSRLDLSQIAVTAWRKEPVELLGRKVVHALGVARNREIELDDLIPKAHFGTVAQLAEEQSRETRPLVDYEDAAQVEDEFVGLIRKVAETKDAKFLAQARKQVHAAIMLSVDARLDGITLQDRYRKTPIEPALSLIAEVADYYRDFKQQCGLIDVADLLAGELEPVPGCQLVLIGGALPPLAVRSLRRIFPQAFFCACSLGHGGL